MKQVKEFISDNNYLDKHINDWLKEHKNITIIDIKYSIDTHHTGALILYQDSSLDEKKIYNGYETSIIYKRRV